MSRRNKVSAKKDATPVDGSPAGQGIAPPRPKKKFLLAAVGLLALWITALLTLAFVVRL